MDLDLAAGRGLEEAVVPPPHDAMVNRQYRASRSMPGHADRNFRVKGATYWLLFMQQATSTYAS
jgi:hypothetical protein